MDAFLYEGLVDSPLGLVAQERQVDVVDSIGWVTGNAKRNGGLETLRQFAHCPLFRYVNDCLALLRNQEEARELQAHFNDQHPHM